MTRTSDTDVIDGEGVYCAEPWRGVVEGRSNTKANAPILGLDRTQTRTDRVRARKRDKRGAAVRSESGNATFATPSYVLP